MHGQRKHYNLNSDYRDRFYISRQRMVETQLVPRGITDRRVIEAMLKVPRHLFVEEAFQEQAYNDFPLPIGEGQTISQPFMVALMTQALKLKGNERVLEIGTGSGYQTAILSLLAERVYSIERISPLAARARRILDSLNCRNVIIRIGDGSLGWEEEAPFDAILVSAATPSIPQPLIEQLAPNGRLVIPVGSALSQELVRVTKLEDGGLKEERLGGCRFVKLIGRYAWQG